MFHMFSTFSARPRTKDRRPYFRSLQIYMTGSSPHPDFTSFRGFVQKASHSGISVPAWTREPDLNLRCDRLREVSSCTHPLRGLGS